MRGQPGKRTPKESCLDWLHAVDGKWKALETRFDGRMTFAKRPEKKIVDGPIADGLTCLKREPEEFEALYYQTEMMSWPANQQCYTLVLRADDTAVEITESDGDFTWIKMVYQVSPSLYHAF